MEPLVFEPKEVSPESGLTFTDFADLADKYEYFLFDCDGVIYIGDKAIRGSFAALNFLISKRKTVFLITNAS